MIKKIKVPELSFLDNKENYSYDKSKIKKVEERIDFLIVEMDKQKKDEDYDAM